jgi:predicted XRE-type DNA-binding protein
VHAAERKLRVQLAMRLNELIEARRLTQASVAQLFGIPQPHVSELKNYKLSRFSSERLLRFVTLLDRDALRAGGRVPVRGHQPDSARPVPVPAEPGIQGGMLIG